MEAEAPAVTDAVGLADTVLLPLSVEVGVAEGVSLPVGVRALEGVPEVLCVAVAELLSEVEPV